MLGAPLYFAKQITLGDLTQTLSAFGIVQGSMSILVDSYTDLARWKSVVDRLATFEQGLQHAEQLPRLEPEKAGVALQLQQVSISHPDGFSLMNTASQLTAGDSLLIQGPSGCGKSTPVAYAGRLMAFCQRQGDLSGRQPIAVPVAKTLPATRQSASGHELSVTGSQ